MPGVLGLAYRFPNANLNRAFSDMLAPMQRNGRFTSEKCISAAGRWALGRVHLGILQPDRQLVDGDSVQVLFHGDLQNENELWNQLDVGASKLRCRGIAALIKLLYRVYGSEFAVKLQGSFCAIVLDEKLKRLILINDFLGSYPVYWFHGSERFVFASELKAVLRDSAIKPVLNPRAVADFAAFGFIFGEKTLVPEIKLLPPSATLTYDWSRNACVVDYYASIKSMFQPSEQSQAGYHDEIRRSFNSAVKRSLSGQDKYLLSLSGGLDSRAVLSAIGPEHGTLSTYTLGAKGCADEVIAERLSALAGLENQFLELDGRYLGDGMDNLRRMVSLTDGMYLTHGLTEVLVLSFLERSDFAVMLRGHGGELAKASLAWPFHTDRHIYEMRSKEEFSSYMLERAGYLARGASLREVFTDDWFAQIKNGARQSLEESIADVPLAPADLCSYLYLTEQHRRFTIASLELFRNYVDVRMPFMDHAFLRVLFRGPAMWRDNTTIHRAIIEANAPALLKVRNSNTGAPVNAGPVVEKLWDNWNSLCRRLNLYGYRHYHSFDRWMKQTLLDSVEQVLLHPLCLSRGIYRESGLRRLIEESRRGIGDHAYLLQVLLILELWQQENS